MKVSVKRNFILQQGLDDPPPQSCPPQYSALVFQPRVVALIVLVGLLLQSPAVFFVLSLLLWWSALLPRWNPFDALYNATLGARPGAAQLTPAPAPRRFAQAMAASFTLAIPAFLILDWRIAAYVMEGLMLAAVTALAFGGFCLGSFIFHLLRGNAAFARRTLPWAQDNHA
jgi:hypothetical protein